MVRRALITLPTDAPSVALIVRRRDANLLDLVAVGRSCVTPACTRVRRRGRDVMDLLSCVAGGG